MTPGARVAAAIELLTGILAEWQGGKEGRGRPADGTIAHYFKNRRFMGSKDRGMIATLTYQILRHKASLVWQATQAGLIDDARSLVMTALMQRNAYNPDDVIALFEDKHGAPISPTERHALGKMAKQSRDAKAPPPDWVAHNVPEWLLPKLQENLGDAWREELAALNAEAPVDLRVNLLKASRGMVIAALRKEEFEAEPTAISPIGIRLRKRAAIFASPTFKAGLFEVQDEGSQLVSLLCEAAPGTRVIDFCAGAGGKTLALAAQMQNKGKILALDTSEKRLAQMKLRLRRAGVDTVECHVITNEKDKFLKRHESGAALVLVDAPCSGSGTWRRNPDLKWRTSPQDLAELVPLQESILRQAAKLVKPGGRLVYVTCSILKEENNQQVEKFLVDNSHFKVVAAEKLWDKLFKAPRKGDLLQLTPHQDGTDGFFAAVLERAG